MDEIRITNESEYNSGLARAINRRTNFFFKDGQLITQHLYTIGKKNFIVNSVFDLNGKQTVADGIKRLIDNEFNSAA